MSDIPGCEECGSKGMEIDPSDFRFVVCDQCGAKYRWKIVPTEEYTITEKGKEYLEGRK